MAWIAIDGRHHVIRLLAFLLVLLLMESVLQVLCLVSDDASFMLGDGRWTRAHLFRRGLGRIEDPIRKDIDANGFQNAFIPDKASIVVLGDSFSYSYLMDFKTAWPHRLSERRVYNMAVPGFGPTHGLVLFDDALAFDPETIIYAVYLGNDLIDSFLYPYYGIHDIEGLRLNSSIAGDIHALEVADPLFPKLLICVKKSNLSFTEHITEPPETNNFIQKHSRLYGLFRAVYHELFLRGSSDALKTVRGCSRNDCMPFTKGNISMDLHLCFTRLSLDIKDPRVGQGYLNMVDSLRMMHERAGSEGTDFIVVIFSTPEYGFAPSMRDANISWSDYDKRILLEELILNDLKADLDDANISYIDTSGVFADSILAGEMVYNNKSHQNERGHEIVARLVDGYLDH
ncbi:hypothetical protein ACFLRF_02775 [Candidatus Altiarchaeota archaeon]